MYVSGVDSAANAGSLATTGHLLQPGLLSQARTPQQLELAVSALASGIDRNATDLAALLTMTGAGLGLSQNLMPQFPVATAPSLVSGVNSTASNTAAILAAATNSGRLDLLGRGGMARLGLQGAYGNLEGGNSAIGALLPQFLGSPAAGLPLSTYSGLLGNSTGGIGTLGGFGAGSIASLLSSRDQGQGNLFGKYMQPSSSLSTAMVQDPLRNQALLEALLQGNRNHFGQTPANAMQQSELSNSSQLSNDLLLQLLATRGAGLTGAEEAKKSG